MTNAPNILVIMCDSARHDAFGCRGNRWIRTPHLDKLAAEGTVFTHAFTPIGLCHPSRACIDTGLHAHVNGQIQNSTWGRPDPFGLRKEFPSYVGLLKATGYRTGYTGQQHLRQELFEDVVPGAWTAFKAAGLSETPRGDRPQRPPFFGEFALPEEQHRDAFTMRGALELLRRYACKSQPWLLQCEYDGRHPPSYLPAKFARMYDPDGAPKPPNFDDSGEGTPAIHRRYRARQMPEPSNETWRRLVAHYAGYITMLDSFTGQILDELERLGMAENTLVLFTSDHGETADAHGIPTKYPTMYDDVLRVPLIVRWPGHVRAGAVEDAFISHIDLLPTLVEIAGGKPPEPLHGRSWAALTRGEPLVQPRRAIYGQLHGWGGPTWYSLRMVRDLRWKYAYSPFVDDELYDLESDPHEIHNLAAQRPEQIAVMRALLAEQMRSVGDPLARQPEFVEART